MYLRKGVSMLRQNVLLSRKVPSQKLPYHLSIRVLLSRKVPSQKLPYHLSIRVQQRKVQRTLEVTLYKSNQVMHRLMLQKKTALVHLHSPLAQDTLLKVQGVRGRELSSELVVQSSRLQMWGDQKLGAQTQ
jgi:hypothetical protein